jgi:dipeptidase
MTENGHWIFAKNSDREPNEAQHLVYAPPGTRQIPLVQTSFIEVNHPRDHYGAWLSKPFQLWGTEMGVNDHGLAIGNEAVFTRVRMSKRNNGLTGMDMIRLALERCRTAKEAVEQICYYVEAYGQDACGGYLNKKFYYHNSFLLCDAQEAYLLETADRQWVYRKLNGFYAISNQLTIGEEWDGISDQAISYAHNRKWIPKHAVFNFSAAYTEPIMTALSKASHRRKACTTAATFTAAKRKLTVMDAIRILRSHPGGEDFQPHLGAMNSICLHASGLLTPSQTTGSMVAELSTVNHLPIWATGSAAPCLSIFKPLFSGIAPEDQSQFVSPGSKSDQSYWWQWEQWHRKALRNYVNAKKIWEEDAMPLEKSWLSGRGISSMNEDPQKVHASLTAQAMRSSLELLRRMQDKLDMHLADPKGLLYRFAWQRWNRKAGLPSPY